MRFKSFIRCSASVAALALTPSALWAQDAGTPAGTTTPEEATAQETPADATGTGAEDETIVVTGLRRSLQSAQNVKRNSEQIVDAIVAEDIGKLPDIAVSDTAARIPGIQVERSGGEASRVLLRGFDRFNYTTTYNGREIFTAETRSVALQDFPAGGISAIEAFKTSSANLVEPGIAGLINVRSRRPFDFTGSEVAGSVWAIYPNQSRDLAPNAQLLLTKRWDTGIGEVGALINFSYTQLHYRDSIRRHGFFIADLAGGRSPDWPEIRYNEAERSRPSINGALQWRPTPDLEFYAEGLWQGFNEDSTDRLWSQPLWGGASYSNIEFDGSSNRILSGTVNSPRRAEGWQGATKRRTNTYQFAVGGNYDAGPLRISADLARTDSTFKLRTESIDFELDRNNYSVNWFTGTTDGPGPTFEVVGIDPTDPSVYDYRGFFEDHLNASGDDWQARLDFEYELGLDFLPRLLWGVRYVNRDASARAGSFYWGVSGRGIPISDVPLDYQPSKRGFRGDKLAPYPVSWPAPTFDSLWDNLTEFRQYNINLTGVGSLDGPPNDPARTFNINEKSWAGYGQLNYAFDMGSVTIDGSLGMRLVKTTTESQGTVFVPAAAPALINFENEYTDWLPNASLRVEFSPGLQLRLAASQTRTRPNFSQLNPSLSLGPPPTCTPGATDCIRTGSGGNPFLDPLESNNYDASLEYYFSRTGFISGAVFRRDMQGFVVTRAFEYDEPDAQTGLPLVITGPVNTSKARIDGFEAQLSTFFDFGGMPDWARNFGIQANATYIDAKADFALFCIAGQQNCSRDATTPPASNVTVQNLRIPDVSKWTYNLVGMYEGGGLTLRLAYNRRTGFAEGDLSQRDGFFTLQGRGHPVSRLDWSSSYAFNDKLTLFFDWTNILGDPFRSDIVRVNYASGVPGMEEVFPMVVRHEESTMTGGIRFRF